MARDATLSALVEYTAWEREKWHEWLRQQGEAAMEVGAGPYGDGRFASVRELVTHVFAAEKRYVERLWGLPLTDNSIIPNGTIDALFQFGREPERSDGPARNVSGREVGCLRGIQDSESFHHR